MFLFWRKMIAIALCPGTRIISATSRKLSLLQPFLDAVGKARPLLLEPIVNMDVNVPEEHMGDVTGGLAGKRARINGTDSARGGELVIKAQVPLAEVADYQTELKAMTGGRGRYAIEFSHYEAVPANVQKQLVEAYKPRVEED